MLVIAIAWKVLKNLAYDRTILHGLFLLLPDCVIVCLKLEPRSVGCSGALNIRQDYMMIDSHGHHLDRECAFIQAMKINPQVRR